MNKMSTDTSLRSNDDKVATGILSTKTDVSGFFCFFSFSQWVRIWILKHVFQSQDRQFALEEDSVMSGRGRCPYNPDSPVTSTLAGKTQLAKYVSISFHAERNTRETLFCGACANFICMCVDSTARRFGHTWSRGLRSRCCHLVVICTKLFDPQREGVAPLIKHV